jgi:prepilin-type N-terminal cleavage/methylation domain-containing protein
MVTEEINMNKKGFTLIEILTVIAIISILVSILVPVVGKAKESAMKRRAATEMVSIKVATMQFYQDHRYMPWPTNSTPSLVGLDKWTTGVADQSPVMEMLTGENAIQKLYLQIPQKSGGGNTPIEFLDPWGQPYQIGMDRNMDGGVLVSGTGMAAWDGNTVMEKVLVISPGPPGENEPLKTFDIQ